MKRIITVLLLIILSVASDLKAQMNIEGDFQMRWYTDSFSETRDNRNRENYTRYLSRLRGSVRASRNITFHTQLSSIIYNETQSARNIGGTGKMQYVINQLYSELSESNVLFFDVLRLRAGRQAFGIGNGLSWGESYYYTDKFDGFRADAALYDFTLSLFGAITGQNLSESGLYPEPGSDQIYALRVGREIYNQNVIGYMINQKLRGSFNDHVIFGGGSTGTFLNERLEYFAEFARQDFNTAPGLPTKGGIGYMGGISYRFPLWIFRSVKVESRYAAYEGDDKSTPEQEIFSPSYASFFWGDRFGYVNGEIGGTFPNRGRNRDGSRIWYNRFYVIPAAFPDLRIQLQYLKINEYKDNDGYNTFDDELSLRLYYRIYRNTQLQLRYSMSFPNEEDRDINNSGLLSSSEDRYSYQRFMAELRVVF